VEIMENGRIAVRSDAVATCYDSPRDDDQLGAGFYQTRDLGFSDDSGNLHLTGTTGGAINVAGRKVSPARVEAAIVSTGLVTSVKVNGIPSSDPERHEEISAQVELRPGSTLDELKSAAADKLRTWELPRHWR
jgi:acyl-coenzyme A synthetase/AMP-(fatty) acid ligase